MYKRQVQESEPITNKVPLTFHLLVKEKKKEITGTLAVTMTGQFLPMQLIYQGTTNRCLPKGVELPDDLNVNYTKNHWSNEEKAIEHLEKVVFPYLKKQKAELKLTDEQKGMLIFDVFIGQVTENVTKIYRAERLCACTCTKQHDRPLSTIGSECKWPHERVLKEQI